MTDRYGVKDMFANKLCPECNAEVMMIWTAQGRSFECMKCKDKLSEELYVVVSSSDDDEKK